ncbi:MAG: carbon-nitrogen hydrolase family protein [Deltaproteobacteria bacterium]|nr:MAG: carbon-nitrogen hydrolase family protein [Deltaproteobacteria bacterium]
MTSTDDLRGNLEQAERLVREAAGRGAQLVCLPENFAFLRREGLPVPCAQDLDGEIISTLRRVARECAIWILGGTFPEAIEGDTRTHNTSVLLTCDGAIAAVYRKLHLFDVDLRERGGGAFRESDAVAPGKDVVVAETPFGVIGLSICYDLRFPELYRAHAERGARWLAVPSAFAVPTGKDHWEVLLRARAIENQAFVLAPAQYGRHNPDRESYGRSLVVDPWGTILAQAPDRPCALVVDCDLDAQDGTRASLPVLAHRRL